MLNVFHRLIIELRPGFEFCWIPLCYGKGFRSPENASEMVQYIVRGVIIFFDELAGQQYRRSLCILRGRKYSKGFSS